MKRSNIYIKIITAVLFLAVVGYIGVYVYNATQNTYVTAAAFSYAIEETVSSHGYVVRSETILGGLSESTQPIANEAEKVASGQAIAVEYTNREALGVASEIHELKLRIAQIEAAVSDDATETAGYASVLDLSRSVQGGNLDRLDEISLKIETYIFMNSKASQEELPELRARLETLEGIGAGMRTVNTPVSGVFSHAVDGFENIGPDNLKELRPSGLAALFETPAGFNRTSGKIITGFKWYYAAIVDAADISSLEPGRSLTLQFSGAYHAQTEMRIESIGRREDGECVVIFSSERGIHEITKLREVRAEVVIREVSGIRVPREAMRLDDDGATFIFLQTGARAERVDVEILSEFGDGYLVRDGAETGSPLRSGATIIVKANNLFHGKVVG